MHTLYKVFIVLLEILATVSLADFLAGVIHWIEDAYFTEETPVIGSLFIRPNVLHHHLPRYFTKLSWWDSSKDLFAAGLLILACAGWLHLLTWEVGLFVVLGVNANQVHKWSHRTRAENGRIISWLQDWHILQTPRHHGLHHKDPKNTYYCPITNLVNPVLEKLSFWTRVEAVIERLTGIAHREDTAVKGQGPAPEWISAYRPAPRAAVIPVEKEPASSACNQECGRCPVPCAAHRLAA